MEEEEEEEEKKKKKKKKKNALVTIVESVGELRCYHDRTLEFCFRKFNQLIASLVSILLIPYSLFWSPSQSGSPSTKFALVTQLPSLLLRQRFASLFT
jgi:hypothetical protein